MKYSLLIIAVLTLISCKPNHKPAATLMYDNNLEVLNGKVKQITEIKYGSDPIDTVIVDFDVHGNITQIITNKQSGDDLVRCEYIYDKNGKKTAVIQRYYEKWEAYKKCRRKWTYKYDGNGRIVAYVANTKMLKENSDSELAQIKYFFKYDTTGYLIRMDRYLDAEHQFINQYKYNDKHFVIEKDYFSGNGYAEGKSIYKYPAIDKKGNWLKRITPSSSTGVDILTRKITYY